MPEVSIKFRINNGRGLVKPGECINLDGPLSPGGVKGLKYGTNMQGGDGSIEFNIGYRKHAPAKKNDGAEVYYGIERVTQHSIMDVQPDKANGLLKFTGQGHGAHLEKTYEMVWAVVPVYAVDSLRWVIWDDVNSVTAQGFPFLNVSQRYRVTTGLADSLITGFDATKSMTVEAMLSEFARHNDSIRGMFPGKEAHPDGLGCYYYHRHRTLNQTAKWYISEDDLRLGTFGVTEDLSKYCNRVHVWFDRTSVGAWELVREDTESQDKYSPGSSETVKLDLTSQGSMTIAVAQQAGDAYLSIYSNPILKGSITLPLQKLSRFGAGSGWAGFIRGGDIVRVERDYGAFSDILVDSTMVDIDAGTIELFTPEPADMENLLADLLAA